MESKMDMSHYSREKLLEEIIRRDEMIASLKQEVQRFRQLFHARKIAVSAETTTKSPHKIIHKDQKLVIFNYSHYRLGTSFLLLPFFVL